MSRIAYLKSRGWRRIIGWWYHPETLHGDMPVGCPRTYGLFAAYKLACAEERKETIKIAAPAQEERA